MKKIIGFMSFALLAFIMAAQAQLTAPVPAQFRALKLSQANLYGTPVSNFTCLNFTPDTVLFDLMVRVDSLSLTSGRAVVNLNWEGKLVRTSSTINPNWQWFWPENDAQVTGLGIPDSLFSFTWNTPFRPNQQFRAYTRLADPQEGFTVPLHFTNGKLRAGITDTSAAIYIGRNAKKVSFGFFSRDSANAGNYRILYNMGFGWGLTSPADSLADSTKTWGAGANAWLYWNKGDIAGAEWIEIIRKGLRVDGKDSTVVSEQLRIEPR
jgi:hypothetical protein